MWWDRNGAGEQGPPNLWASINTWWVSLAILPSTPNADAQPDSHPPEPETAEQVEAPLIPLHPFMPTIVPDGNPVSDYLRNDLIPDPPTRPDHPWFDRDLNVSLERWLGTPGDDQIVGNDERNVICARAGDDVLAGSGGPDILFGGSGADIYVYDEASDSTGQDFDRIMLLDTETDRIDLPVDISGISDAVEIGTLSRMSFDADLEAALGSEQLAAGEAVLFRPDDGTFSGRTFLVADANGEAGYQAGEDYLISLVGGAPGLHLTIDLFV